MGCYTLPPSPALSDFDSLDGVDLDAYLTAQGPLSIFPTPRLRDYKASCPALVRDNSSGSLDTSIATTSEYAAQAQLFVATVNTVTPSPGDIKTVEHIFERARLPSEVLAIAYSMLESLAVNIMTHNWLPASTHLLLGALALAEIQITDYPHKLKYWLKLDSSGSIQAAELDNIKMKLFESLGWSLHGHCNESTISRFEHLLDISPPQALQRLPLPRLYTSGSTTTLWAYGQLTPAEQSPCPVIRLARPEPYFLPLL